MKTVRIETPSRLHFGLIDLTGRLGRIDGSIGLTLDKPSFVLEARKAKRVEAVGAGVHQERVERLAKRLRALWEVGGVHLRYEETIPAHVGLGSGTQAALSVIHALAALYEVPLSAKEAARLSGRGGASGIGLYAFEKGRVSCGRGASLAVPKGRLSAVCCGRERRSRSAAVEAQLS